jgi:hypothetical protein
MRKIRAGFYEGLFAGPTAAQLARYKHRDAIEAAFAQGVHRFAAEHGREMTTEEAEAFYAKCKSGG